MDTKPKSQPQAAEWWSSLDAQWQAIFRKAIGINSQVGWATGLSWPTPSTTRTATSAQESKA